MFQKFWGVIFFLAFSPAAWAYDFYTGGIYYNITSSSDKTVEVTSKTGYSSDYSGKVTIPETVSYNGTVYSVTAIGKSAFDYCRNLTSVTIPKGVVSVGEAAFSGCTGLKEVHISNMAAWCKISFYKYSDNYPWELSWTTNPLYYAHNLYLNDTLVTDLKIPEDITSIGELAFSGCTSLTSVTIPKGVVSVGEAAFSGCTGLKAVYISDVEAWCKISFSPTNIRGEDAYDTNYSWESNPLTYAHNLYLDGKLATDLKIPENVTTICKGTFSGCSGLKSITIPKSVTTIDSDAFSGCTGLNAVHISDVAAWCKIAFRSTGRYRFASNPLYYAHNLYLDGNLVTNIPEDITSIGAGAFYGCTSLTSVTIPKSVTFIGERTFSGCTGLTSVTIPQSVTSIGKEAFESCSGLTSVTIPESVTFIEDYAFEGCTGLTSITIPNSVTTIGYDAFGGCGGLKEVWFNANSCKDTWGYYSTVFMGCTSLKTVHIGENVKYISNKIFYGCTGLEKFEGKWASKDYRCLVVRDTLVAFAPSGLTEYTIPDGVTSIGSEAFEYCEGLTSITIPESVTSIGSEAFEYCEGLTSITIPESVTSIGSGAFYYCRNLQTITPLGTIPPTCSYSFGSDTYKNATVNYPKGSLHAYKTADYWKNFTYPTAEELLKPKFINGTAGQTTYSCTLSYTRDIEYPVSKLYMAANEKEYPVDADTTLAVIPVTVIDLEPETEYDAQFIIETIYGDQVVMPVTFTTDTVHLTAQPAKTTDAKATLEAEVECDAETGYGFEWRRYGAPDNLPPTRVEAYNIDGKIAGTLRKLTPEAYYEFRPYYRTVSGKYYYDEWVAFGTFDYGVEWDPTVSTRAGEVEGNNSTISAYVVEGSDELLSQGFEYWTETPAARSTASIATRSTASEPERIEGSGTLMSVTLTGLDYNTTYYYRAYATTAKKTTYGNTESFTTGKKPVEKDFKPTGITPEDGSVVTELKTFTLEFAETPSLAAEAQPITLAGNDTLLTATLSAGEGNTLEITLADTLKVAGEYTLTIPEGSFGDDVFAADPTVGHCNPELTYTYTIKEPEPVEPDEPDEPSSITETTTDAEHIAVYNLQGVLVLETNDAADLKTLQNGAYIVNGKTMIIAR